MKKTTICTFAIIAIAAVGCTKNELLRTAEPVADNGIVLYANDANLTKTVTDPDKFTVKWAEGDSLAVFTWKHGETEPADAASWWVGNSVRFRISDVEKGKFNLITECASTNKEYPQKLAEFKERYNEGKTDLDWYVIYPGNMYTPSRPLMMITVLGKNMVQNGKDNLDHLSSLDVMFGKAEGTTKPDVKMHHLGTLMEFTVTNGTADAIDVKSITVDAGDEVIGGEFRTELNGNPVEVKKDSEHINGGTKPLTTCELKVNNVSLKPGEPGKFYMILAPFHIEAGKDVTITVTTDNGFWSKTMTATGNGLDFAAGAKSSANLNVDALEIEKEEIATKQVTLGFCNNAGGSIDTPLLSITGCETYTIAAGAQNQSQVDIVAWHKGLITLGAPNYQWMPYPDVTKWTVRNGTSFKRANISQSDFDGFTKYSAIVKAYDNATNGSDMFQINEGKDNYVFVKTASGQYAVIRIDSLNNKTLGDSQDKYESVTLTVKYANQE